MNAIRVSEFGAPETMRLETVPDPAPAPGELVVAVKAIGVNPVDTYIRSGAYAKKPALPYTPGHDAAGTVLSLGPGAARFKAGDRVYTARTLSGAYAQQVLCREDQVYPLPDTVSFAQGAALGVPYGTAHRALFGRAGARAGETVLVHGASGGVGVAAVQLARAAGLTVIGTAGTERGLELATEEGAHHALNHRTPNYLQKIMDLTSGRGADVILEMLANVNLGRDLDILAFGGRVVVIGSRGTVEIDPRAAMGRDASILGMSLMNEPQAGLAAIHAALFAGLQNGTLRPIIGKELPLKEAAQAHQAVMEPGSYGKIVLLPP